MSVGQGRGTRARHAGLKRTSQELTATLAGAERGTRRSRTDSRGVGVRSWGQASRGLGVRRWGQAKIDMPGTDARSWWVYGSAGADRTWSARALLHDAAVAHHQDVVGQGAHHRQVVGDEQVAQAQLRLQPGQEVEDLVLHQHVQRGHRLVAHHQPRARRECARDGHALPLTAGQFVRVPVGHAPTAARPGPATPPPWRRRRGRSPTPKVRSGSAMIRSTVHIGFSDAYGSWNTGCIVCRAARQPGAAQADELLARQPDRARGRGDQAEHHVCGGRLAGAGLAHDGRGSSVADRERHVVHGTQHPAPAADAVLLRDVRHLQHRLGLGRRRAFSGADSDGTAATSRRVYSSFGAVSTCADRAGLHDLALGHHHHPARSGPPRGRGRG